MQTTKSILDYMKHKNLPELCEDTLLQTQVLVPVLFYQSSLPLDRVLYTPHGLCEFNTDLLLCPLKLDSQCLLVLELRGRAQWERNIRGPELADQHTKL